MIMAAFVLLPGAMTSFQPSQRIPAMSTFSAPSPPDVAAAIPRRAALAGLAAAAAAAVLRPPPSTAATPTSTPTTAAEADLGPAFAAASAAAAGSALPPVDGAVSLADLYARLIDAPETVARMDFYGTLASVCVVTLAPTGGDGTGRRLWVRAGYPVESPRSPISPLSVQAKARDSGIPFSMQTPTSFLRKKPVVPTETDIAGEADSVAKRG